jgi:hypothetical protein
MLDTVQLRHLFATQPTIELARSFRSLPQHSSSFKAVWVMNAPHGSTYQPRLTWTQTNCGDWLSVEASLPRLLFGRNTVPLLEEDIQAALNKLSAFVYQTVGLEFDAATALVGRVDYFVDFRVGETNVDRYLAAIATATLPRFDRHTINTTILFRNKSKQISVYDKTREILSHHGHSQLNQVMLGEAKGMLRLEVRHKTSDACQRLKEKHRLSRRTALDLFTAAIAFKELSGSLSDLGIDREVLKYDSRIDALHDYYGDTAAFRRLAGFIKLLEHYGENFWRSGYGGYSRTMYYEHMRMVKGANAWLRSDVALPPLHLIKTAFSRLAA